MHMNTLLLDSLGTTAHLDTWTGLGLLTLPHPSTDVQFPGCDGMAAAAWNGALQALYGRGWTLLMDEDDEPVTEGYTACGRQVVGLYGLRPIIRQASLDEMAQALVALRAVAKVRTN